MSLGSIWTKGFIVFLFLFSHLAFGDAKRKPAPRYFLTKAELKQLKPNDLKTYMSKFQKAWIAYETFINKKSVKKKSAMLSIGLSTADAADPSVIDGANLWCQNIPDRICFAAGNKSCFGSSETDSSRLCKNSAPCQINGQTGMTCNPDLFGYTKSLGAMCLLPDKNGYNTVSKRCLELAQANGKKSIVFDEEVTNLQFDISKTTKFLEEHKTELNAFCAPTREKSATWVETCVVLSEARATAEKQIAEYNRAGQVAVIEEAVSGLNAPAPPPQPAAADPIKSEKPSSVETAEVTAESLPQKQWCDDGKGDFNFKPAKSEVFLHIGRQQDGLRTIKNKDGKAVERQITRGTNCMLCGIRLACGDLVGNKIDHEGMSFVEACNLKNKALEERVRQIHVWGCAKGREDGEGRHVAFAHKWLEIKRKLDKHKDNKEDAANLVDLVNEYYELGNRAGLFCSNGPETLNNENTENPENAWKNLWGEGSFSPIVAVPHRKYFKEDNDGADDTAYMKSLSRTFGLDKISSYKSFDGKKSKAAPDETFLCDSYARREAFNTPTTASPRLPATEPVSPTAPGRLEGDPVGIPGEGLF